MPSKTGAPGENWNTEDPWQLVMEFSKHQEIKQTDPNSTLHPANCIHKGIISKFDLMTKKLVAMIE